MENQLAFLPIGFALFIVGVILDQLHDRFGIENRRWIRGLAGILLVVGVVIWAIYSLIVFYKQVTA